MALKEKPKSSPNIKQNIRQKKVAIDVVVNGSSMAVAMKKAGYSKAYSTHPEKLTRTRSWQELIEEYLPDSLLTKKHNELLNKKEQIVVRNGKESEIIVTDEIDVNAVKAGVEMGYKLKGRFAPDKIEHTITAVRIINYGDNTTN